MASRNKHVGENERIEGTKPASNRAIVMARDKYGKYAREGVRRALKADAHAVAVIWPAVVSSAPARARRRPASKCAAHACRGGKFHRRK